MKSLNEQISSLKMDLHQKNHELRKAKSKLEELEEDITYEEENIESDIESQKDDYIEEKQEEIKEEYEQKIEELQEEISSLNEKLNIQEVDDTEELVEARERKEYLNTAGGLLNAFYLELKKSSTPYFVDLAYTEKQFNMKQFQKEFKSIPERVNELQNIRENLYAPFSKVENSAKDKSFNSLYYLWSTVGAIAIPFMLIGATFKTVRNIQYLHESARLYHRMMHSLVALKDKTDEEVNSIFGKLLKSKSQLIRDNLSKKTKELEDLQAQLQKDLDSIVFKDDDIRRAKSLAVVAKRNTLEKTEELISRLEEEIEDLESKIGALTDKRKIELEEERKHYLEASEDRSVQLPVQLLYDSSESSNSFFELKEGLYLYNDRDTVNSFLQILTFQLRNIMAWGSIQFRVLDLLGGEFASPLMLPASDKANAQDITISSLREEREQTIEMMHDLFRRRQTQVLAVADNISDYNLKQKETGSSPLAYQLIFIILDDAVKVEEKLTQLIYAGPSLGLLVFVFMKQELLNVQLAKTIETFFPAFIELTDTGLTTYDPISYRESLEAQEADKKNRI